MVDEFASYRWIDWASWFGLGVGLWSLWLTYRAMWAAQAAERQAKSAEEAAREAAGVTLRRSRLVQALVCAWGIEGSVTWLREADGPGEVLRVARTALREAEQLQTLITHAGLPSLPSLDDAVSELRTKTDLFERVKQNNPDRIEQHRSVLESAANDLLSEILKVRAMVEKELGDAA